MERFDIVEIRSVAGTRHAVVLQSSYYDFLATRFVAPLHLEAEAETIERITPTLNFAGARHVIRLDLMLTAPRHIIGRTVGSADGIGLEISMGIDRLMQGFG